MKLGRRLLGGGHPHPAQPAGTRLHLPDISELHLFKWSYNSELTIIYLPGLASLASQSILSLVLQIVASVYDMRIPPPHRPDSCLKFNMPIVNFAHNYKEGQGEKRKGR